MKKEKTLREHAIMVENLIFIGIVLLILSKYLAESALFWPLFLGGIGLAIAGGVYQHKYHKCPACRCQLPIYRKGIQFCPQCGRSLNEAEETQNVQK